MKLNYIIPSLAALMATAVVGCSEDDEQTYMDELQVSQSYVAIDGEGGSTTIVLKAKADWTFDFDVDVAADSLNDETGVVKYKKPTPQMQTKDNDWVTISPSSGAAGETEVTFTAEATTDSREIAIKVKIGDKYQNIIVKQEAAASEIPVSTVKDVLDGVDSKTYRVKGSVGAISNTTYGNWIMTDDEGNRLTIYGTLDKLGATRANPLDNTTNGWNIELGDVVTVEGPRSTYGTTIELVDVTVVKVEKALLKAVSSKTIEMAESTFDFVVSQKGKGIAFSTDCNWMSFADNGYTVNKDGDLVFKIHATENATDNIRTGNLIFESTLGDDKTRLVVPVKQLSMEVDTSDDALFSSLALNMVDATRDDPYPFYIEVKEAKVTFKNGSNTFIEDATGGLLIYSSNVSLKVGDVVSGKVYGKGYGYNGLPEATEFFTELATVKSGDAPEPEVVTLEQLTTNFDSYVSRLVRVENVKVADENPIELTYSKLTSAGAVTDGTNTFELVHNSPSKYNGEKIYYYVNVPAGSTVSFTCIPTINRGNKLGIWDGEWFK